MQIVVNDLLTTYTRNGKGSVVVLVHGWGDSSASFRGFENTLSSSFDVINVDLPGFGQSEIPREVWGLEEYANFLAAFVAKLEIPGVYAYIGHSNGCAVLIKGLGTKVLHSQKLVLLAAAGIRDSHTTKRFMVKVIAKTGKIATFFLPEQQKRKLRKKLYGVVGSDMLVVPQLQETFKKTVRQDVQEDAKALKVPTLLIYGTDDSATPITDGERFVEIIPGAALKPVEGVGHYVHQEQHESVLEAIEEFLR